MVIRPPKLDALILSAADDLETEIRAERACALERAGSRAERAMAAFHAAVGDERASLIKPAADALHGYMIQRELMGFRGHAEVLERLAVPRQVVAKIGVR